ncbi:MAG TPA: thiamine pyrophosphate-binding protein, partial [Burkholderiaceae bacterium]
MAETVGEFLLRRLAQWGVRRVYGVPGEGVAGIVGALERGVAGIELVPARHEEGAAFMACAHARFGGDVGVCLAGAGPGAIHLLGGLYDAALNRQPVLAIVGELPGSAALDLGALLDDVAPGAVHRADAPQRVAERLDAALQTARGERRVACLIVPADVQQREAEPAAAPRGMNPPGPLAPGAQ